MPRERPEVDVGATGLAGGPGPTPPGVDDGTPRATRIAAGESGPQSAEAQGEEARKAERTAGTRGDELPAKGKTAPRGSRAATRGRRRR